MPHTSATSCVFKFFSICYWLISDYGQSIARPIAGLLIIFFSCWFIFFSFGIEKINAPYLSLMQILKPYSLLYDHEPRMLLDSFCLDHKTHSPNSSEQKNVKEMPCGISLAQYRYGWLFIIISVLESTFSLVFFASLLLALRWNFRKA